MDLESEKDERDERDEREMRERRDGTERKSERESESVCGLRERERD